MAKNQNVRMTEATQPMSYRAPKYPRLLVLPKRHKKLAAEAVKRDITIADLVEEKLAKLD